MNPVGLIITKSGITIKQKLYFVYGCKCAGREKNRMRANAIQCAPVGLRKRASEIGV